MNNETTADNELRELKVAESLKQLQYLPTSICASQWLYKAACALQITKNNTK
jgi:hypothetical protein